MKPGYRWFLSIIGLVMIGLFVYIAALGDLTRQIPRFLIAFGVLYVLYVAAVFLVSRLNDTRRPMLILIFGVAVAARIVLIGSTPALSDDIYRYVWEGRVLQAGYNPFSHPPDSEELRGLRDSDFDNISHRHMETIYPPLAQGAFYVGAAVGPGVIPHKIIYVLFDIATMLLIAFLLRARRRNPALCVVYGWSPLVMLEFAHSGHMDSLGIFLLLLAILLVDRGRTALGFVSMALSFLAKYFSIVLIPFFMTRKRYVGGIALFGFLVLLGYLPFVGASTRLASSLGIYSRYWDFNSFGYTVARQLVEDPAVLRASLAVLTILFGVYQGYRQQDLIRYTFLVTGCALLLTPTLYPWYLCWLIPFLCFHVSRAWLFLTGAIALSYTVWPVFRETGVWRVGWGVLLIEYVPFFVLLVFDAYRRRLGRRSVTS
jgi:hypothetical protein